MRRQRKKGGMRMDRIQKLLLLGAAALIIWFGFTLHDDWENLLHHRHQE